MKILIADDHALSRRILAHHLENDGYEVVACSEGPEAWSVLLTEDAPRLAVIDWMMPGMDGLEICRELRKLRRRPYTYVIMLTGRTETEDVIKGLEAGADDYLIKPFDPHELLVRVRSGRRVVELQAEVFQSEANLRRVNEDLQNEMQGREAAQEALRASEERYRAIFDNAAIGIAVFDPSGRFLQANSALVRMLGYDEEEIFDLTVREITHPDDLQITIDNHDALVAGLRGSYSFEKRYLRKDGQIFWADVFVSSIRNRQGRHEAAVSVITDITEQKTAERFLLQTQRSKAVAEFAGMIAYSFNNVLQVVIGGAEVALTNLELGNLDDIREALKQTIGSAFEGAEMVKRLQYLVRVQAEKRSEEPKAFDLSLTVHRAIEMSRIWWRTGTEKAGIKVILDRHLAPECFVKGHENEFFEVVVNLVKNAAGALPEGGRITVRTEIHDGEARLRVADNGVGIAPGDLERIFDPFRKSENSESIGMGLEFVDRVVRGHGGRVTVESVPGQGTAFTVLLPLSGPPEPAAAPAPRGELMPEMSILLADDNEALVRTLRDALEKTGQRVIPALSGRKALELFKTNKIDLVICDLEMPDINGRQVGRAIDELCRERKTPRPPFILLTGWSPAERNEERLPADPVDAVIAKPFDTERLFRTILDVLRKSSG